MNPIDLSNQNQFSKKGCKHINKYDTDYLVTNMHVGNFEKDFLSLSEVDFSAKYFKMMATEEDRVKTN